MKTFSCHHHHHHHHHNYVLTFFLLLSIVLSIVLKGAIIDDFSFSQLNNNTLDFQTLKTYSHTSNFAIVHEFSSIIFENCIQIVINKGPLLSWIMLGCKNTDIHWIFTTLRFK